MARRRLTLAEVAMLSPSEQARWRRRHGITASPPSRASPATVDTLEPPGWLSPRHKALFHETVAAAPVGLLQPIDRGLLSAFCVQLATLEEAMAETGLEARRLARQTAASLAQLANALCLTPVLRAKFALDAPPPKPDEAEGDRWGELRRFPVIHDGGKRSH